MSTMARFLSIMGMGAVGYYALVQAGLPVHATCFRTLDSLSLSQNPFGLFVSLLQPLLIAEPLCSKAMEILSRREIFHPRVLELIELAEGNDLRLNHDQAADFVKFGVETFKWHASSVVTLGEHQELDAGSPLLADVVGFRGPHLNHLTPRTLDIDRVESLMRARGFPAKAVIEEPPRRKCPILLCQKSFRALEEPVNFLYNDDTIFQVPTRQDLGR